MIIHWKDKTKTRFTSSYRMHFYTEFIHLWRARLFVFFHDNIAGLILIHAPVKGATVLWFVGIIFFHDFNPRTREGCDLLLYALSFDTSRFQSTHPWRVRQLAQYLHGVERRISIHAPVKGATAFKLAQSLSALSSIILRADWKAVQFLSQLSGYCSFL